MGCKGGFSQAQCCHMASFHYLPSRATRVIDRMQSRVYIGNFSAEGNVFVGNLHDSQFARTLLSCLSAEPHGPPLLPINTLVTHCSLSSIFLQCAVLEFLLNIHGKPCCAMLRQAIQKHERHVQRHWACQICPSTHADSYTRCGHLAESGSTHDCYYYYLYHYHHGHYNHKHLYHCYH